MRCFLMIALLLLGGVSLSAAAQPQQASAPENQMGVIVGTVLDPNGGVVPRATVILEGPGAENRQVTLSGDNGFFQISRIRLGQTYHVNVRAPDFAEWRSAPLTPTANQYFLLLDVRLRMATVQISVTALTPEQIAVEQIKVAETQRVLGIVPNFYVNFDPNPAPLAPRLKFHLALKTLTDPVTLAGFALNAGIYQAAGWPSYRSGMAGFGQRLGATFAGGYVHVLVGNSLLPAVLHQDPRYFYQGTGTTGSRLRHALAGVIFSKGDNGQRTINYSGLGGDLVSGAMANAYYPPRDRGLQLVLRGALLGTGGRIAFGLAQEFLLNRGRRPPDKRQNASLIEKLP